MRWLYSSYVYTERSKHKLFAHLEQQQKNDDDYLLKCDMLTLLLALFKVSIFSFLIFIYFLWRLCGLFAAHRMHNHNLFIRIFDSDLQWKLRNQTLRRAKKNSSHILPTFRTYEEQIHTKVACQQKLTVLYWKETAKNFSAYTQTHMCGPYSTLLTVYWLEDANNLNGVTFSSLKRLSFGYWSL